MTLLLMSSVRLIFYVPLASFRVAALLLPALINIPSEASMQLMALGVIFYVGIIPVHFVNFIVRLDSLIVKSADD